MNVNSNKLNLCLALWRETFNDCACCPLSPNDCFEDNEDTDICVKRLAQWLTDADEVVEPQ